MSHKDKHSRAVSDYSAQIRLNPGDAWAYYSRGVEYLRLGQSAAALSDFGQAISLRGDVAEFYCAHGWANIGCGYVNEPISDFDQAIVLDPRLAKAFDGRARAHLEAKHFDDALRDYKQAVSLAPDDPTIRFHRARALIQVGQHNSAEEDLAECIRLDPRNPRFLCDRAWLRLYFTRVGKWQDALVDLELALCLPDPPVEAHLERGLIRVVLEDWSGAITDLEKFLNETPFRKGHQYAEIWLYLAKVFIGERLSADQWLKAVLESRKKHLEGRGLLPDALRVWPMPVLRYLAGEVTQEQLMQQSTETVPSAEEQQNTQLLEACFFCGENYLAQGDCEQALPLLQRALELPPNAVPRWVVTSRLARK